MDGQHQDVDRTPRGRVSQNDAGRRWRKYVHGMVWHGFHSRKANPRQSPQAEEGDGKPTSLLPCSSLSIWGGRQGTSLGPTRSSRLRWEYDTQMVWYGKRRFVVLLCAEVVRESQTMWPCTANARRPTVDRRCRGRASDRERLENRTERNR